MEGWIETRWSYLVILVETFSTSSIAKLYIG